MGDIIKRILLSIVYATFFSGFIGVQSLREYHNICNYQRRSAAETIEAGLGFGRFWLQ